MPPLEACACLAPHLAGRIGTHVELAAPESGHAASYHLPTFSLMPLVTSASIRPHGGWVALDVLISLVPGTEALVRRRPGGRAADADLLAGAASGVLDTAAAGPGVPGAAGAAHDLRREHTAWIQRVHAVLFHQGAPVFHDLSRAGAPQELAALARAHLSPAGQQQVMLCLRMLEATGGELDGLRGSCSPRPATCAARKSSPTRSTASGPSPRWR